MALAVGAPVGMSGVAAHPRDQDMAYSEARAGNIRPLPEIERGVLPRMRGSSYLGPEFDPGSGTYRLKFMRSGSVIWVDVDARTGAIIGRSGD
jgi:hypothetical protein